MKKLFVLVVVLFISGCSTKFAYRNIDWLAYWYLDDYIEFTDEQEKVFDEKLGQWLDWHKGNELPQYVAHLEELANDVVSKQISLERIDYHQSKARLHWERLRAHVVPDLVEMSPMLQDEQVTHLFAALEKQNKEREEELAERAEEDPEKRTKKRLKNNLKEMKNWLGKLTSEQETLIENTLGQYQSNSHLWLSYRRDYQNELRSLFATDARDEGFKQQLNELLLNPEVYRTEELSKRNDINSEVYKNMLLSIDILATDKQRGFFKREVLDYATDFNELM